MDFLAENHIIHSWTGLFHTLVAILALMFGTVVLIKRKGTHSHRKMGYTYCVLMLLMNGSALGMYNLGGFNLFHGFALVSLASITLGIVPAMRRRSVNWRTKHFYFMSWSVVGLYCAFWAELGVRLFDMRYFWWVVLLATVLTALIGAITINKEARKLNLN